MFSFTAGRECQTVYSVSTRCVLWSSLLQIPHDKANSNIVWFYIWIEKCVAFN